MERETRTYDKEFKINVSKLYMEGGKTYKELSEDLGVPKTTIKEWVKNYRRAQGDAFPGKGNLEPKDAEVAKLRRELQKVTEERDILKKVVGIFSSKKE